MVAALRGRPRAGRDRRRPRRGRRRPPARRRPELPVQALQRRVDARQRPAARRPARSSGSTSCSRDRHHGRSCRRRRRRPDDRARRRRDRPAPGVRHQPAAGVRATPTATTLDGIVGSISEKGLLDRAYRDPSVVERTVGEVMDPPLPTRRRRRRRSTRRSRCCPAAPPALVAVRGEPAGRRRHQARPARVPRAPRRQRRLSDATACRRASRRSGRRASSSSRCPCRSCEALARARPRGSRRARSARSCRPGCPNELEHFLQYRLATCAVDPAAQPWLGRAILVADRGGRHASGHRLGRASTPHRTRRAGSRSATGSSPSTAARGTRTEAVRGAVRLGGRPRRRPLRRLDLARQRARRCRLRPSFGFEQVGEQIDEIDGLEHVFETIWRPEER